MTDASLQTSLPPPAGRAVPQSVTELTAEWLTACLRHAGALSSGHVESFRHERIGQGKGFVGRLARLELVYRDPLPSSPPRLIAKFASDDGRMREMMGAMGGYEREVRFYRELARDVGVPTARCFLAHYDPSGHFLLLLEDLAPAASASVERGLTLDEARLVMEQLATLHAKWWNRSDELPWLEPDEALVLEVRDRYLRALPEFEKHWGDRYPTITRAAHAVGHVFEDDEWVRQIQARPRTLVHNDLHVDNIFLPNDAGGRLAFIDWQGVSFARHGACDVTRILCLGMTTELRRRHAGVLLRHYHDRLTSLGVEGYSLRQAMRRYREETVSMVLVGVLAFDAIDFEGEQSAGRAVIIGDRIEAAVRDARLVRALSTYVRLIRARRVVRRLLGR